MDGKNYPKMVFADKEGSVYDQSDWRAAGKRGREIYPLEKHELIPLPEGSEIFLLPGRVPMGYKSDRDLFAFEGKFKKHGKPIAVAAFLPPAYTQYYLPAYQSSGSAPILPLYAYTAIAFMDGEFYVPAVRSDPDKRQDPAGFDCRLVEEGINKLLASSKENRLYRHLSRCAREYFCPAARNLFMGRWEAPLPSSPGCNARCIGCISLQPSGCCPATQERIKFVPRAEEISEVAVSHFLRVPDGVASFGQGCEGEPLLVAEVLVDAVSGIRRETNHGTINLNTNGSIPDAVERLADAGLDAVRVSLNSARPDLYELYYRPSGYGFDKVYSTLRTSSKKGLYCSLNYFVFPGVTDQPEEIEALCRLIEETGIKMIQWRNLNIDPDLYLRHIPAPAGSVGIRRTIEIIKDKFPDLRHGYFNPSVKTGNLLK